MQYTKTDDQSKKNVLLILNHESNIDKFSFIYDVHVFIAILDNMDRRLLLLPFSTSCVTNEISLAGFYRTVTVLCSFTGEHCFRS